MNNHPDQRQETSAAEETPDISQIPSRPLYVRVLALIGALAVIALSVAYAWSIATGGIFWM